MVKGRGKLSSQISEKEEVEDSRLTRTERKQLREKRVRQEREFESAKAEAKRLTEEEFIEKTYRDAYGKTQSQPFTLERYREEYPKLKPEVQQFFVSPEEIAEKKEALKESELLRYGEKILLKNGV